MIASLNIMAKTFAKITKMFVGLSVTIVAIKRRLVLINELQKWNLREKLGKENPDCKKSTIK